MTEEEKSVFDYVNKNTYMFRLQLERAGFDISSKAINGCTAYFVLYRNLVIGTVSFGEQYASFMLYSYIHKLFPKLEDFHMVDYFDDDPPKFLYDKFDSYMAGLKKCLDSLSGIKDAREETPDEPFDMVKARLMEFLVSDDLSDSFLSRDSLPMTILRHDIASALKEISSLEQSVKDKSEAIQRVFMKS